MKRRGEVLARLMRRRTLLEARKARTIAGRHKHSRFYAMRPRRRREADGDVGALAAMIASFPLLRQRVRR